MPGTLSGASAERTDEADASKILLGMRGTSPRWEKEKPPSAVNTNELDGTRIRQLGRDWAQSSMRDSLLGTKTGNLHINKNVFFYKYRKGGLA